MKHLSLLFVILLFPFSTKAAETKCDTWAYTLGGSLKELPLRREPNNQAKVVGATTFVDGTGSECHLLKAKDSWVYADCEPKPNADLKDKWIKGWVEAKHLGTTVGAYAPNGKNDLFYAEPNYQSKSIKLPKYKDSIFGEVLSCQDKWLKVRILDPSKDMLEYMQQPDYPKEDLIFLNKIKKGTIPREGWLAPEGHCHNPLTTCV